MPSKPNPIEPGYARASDRFCEARLLELMSIARRVGTNADENTVPSTGAGVTDDPSSMRVSKGDPPGAIFHLTTGPRGWWELREHKGSKAGLFRTRQAAIKYARDESPGGQFVIIDDIACPASGGNTAIS